MRDDQIASRGASAASNTSATSATSATSNSSATSATRKTTNQMKYIDRLLQGAPVEWCPLSEVAEIKNGKDYKHLSSGEIPVYGSGGIMTYVDDFSYDQPSVLIPRKGSLNNLFYVDTPFWNVDTIFYTAINVEVIVPKFFYYYLSTLHLERLNLAGGVPSLTQKVLNKIEIPIPPVAVQEEVVRVLDKFTALEAELEAELDCRKRQYGYYRDALLTFDLSPSDGLCHSPLFPAPFAVEWRPLGEVLVRTRGTKITASQMKDLHKEGAPIKIFAGGKTVAYISYEDLPEKDICYEPSIIVKSRGIIGFEYYDKPFSHKNEMWAYHSEDESISIKYVYYYLVRMESVFQRIGSTMQMPQISIPDTDNYKIPVPPLAVQERIVEILNKFDTLVNSISEGLPREIELRRKQYEYYRDALLSF